MNRTRILLMVGVAAAASVAAAPSQADTEYLLNGDLEVLGANPPLFEFWTNNAGTTLAAQAISGSNSARIGRDTGSLGNALNQTLNDAASLLSTFTASFDFAASDPGSATARSMQFLLRTVVGANTGNVNLRVVSGSQPGLGNVEVFDGAAFQTALADVVNFSISETGVDFISNSATIVGDYSGATPFYTITVNGTASESLSHFQGGAPAQGTTLKEISWQSGNLAAGAWAVVDDISLVGPDPPAGLPGDFNDDGSVDGADFLIWQRGLGGTHTPAQLDDWKANFGMITGGGAATLAQAVPEPASLRLVISLFVALVHRRLSVVH